MDSGSTITLSLVKLFEARLRVSKFLRNSRVAGKVVRSLDSRSNVLNFGRN